ncbi:hypothetical protein [Saccharothrix sp. NRRL B-16314]|uniref:hypothetical protein n=1 Tax=Saccharothrix sp. NRRL B-16314 TaxID=1463825 RepID=UPI00052520F5|nr:hypothetical protein [Saccharothrix sp. NRRL B-16314]
MTLKELIEVGTLIFIAGAFAVGFRQMRSVAKQAEVATKQAEAAVKQTEVIVGTLEQSSHDAQIASEKDLAVLFLGEPDVMRWHFEAHGFGTLTVEQGKTLTFILLRLGTHEAMFLRNAKCRVPGEIWESWERVIAADFRIDEYKEAWKVARRFYAVPFANYVDKLL